MGAIIIRVSNASRRPLDDRIDIEVTSTQSDATIARVNDVAGNAPIRITGLDERLTYRVSVLPRRHRPVARMAFAGPDDRPTTLEFHAPLHPERVRAVTFPLYPDLPRELRDVLEASTIDGLSAEALYTALTEVQRAGLLNVFSKMARLTIDGRSAWSFVERVYGVRPDRIYIDVSTSFRDLVGAAATAGLLREVSGSLHEPPAGFCQAGSFKTADPYGNLQLTFFCTIDQPHAYKVDADVDDAAGLGHAFQVIRNWVTDGTTHPYDIHQILVFRQDVVLPYDLV